MLGSITDPIIAQLSQLAYKKHTASMSSITDLITLAVIVLLYTVTKAASQQQELQMNCNYWKLM